MVCILLGCASLTSRSMAQGPGDAYRNNLQGLQGTARARALGGAVGALGADPTAVSVNPAGSALYSRGTVSLTLDPGFASTPISWSGYGTSESNTEKYNRIDLANISYMSPLYFYSDKNGKLKDWGFNFGISYNKSYDYKRNYRMITGMLGSISGSPSNPQTSGYDLTDYIAARAIAFGVPFKRYNGANPFTAGLDPLVTLGVNAALIEGAVDENSSSYRTLFSQFVPNGGPSKPLFRLPPIGSSLAVNESGGKNEFDLTVGFSAGDYVQLGLTARIGSIIYNRSSSYRQDYYWKGASYDGTPMVNESYMTLNNSLSNSGAYFTGVLGALVALGDYGRVGVSYELPKYLSMKESYAVSAESMNSTFRPEDARTTFSTDVYDSSYNMLLPGQLTVSAMAFLGGYGLVSYDFAWRDLGQTKLYLGGSVDSGVTNAIKEDYTHEMTHRVGLEFIPMPKLALRAGYSFTGNPLKANQLKAEPAEGLTYDPLPAGTIPDFTLPRSYSSYSGGIGYQFSPSIRADVAYVYSVRNEKVYSFSGYVFRQGGADNVLTSYGGDMKDIRNDIVLTLSMYF